MVKEAIHMLMELTTMEIGLMISNMALAWSHGSMVQNMRALTLMAKRRVKESLLSMEVAITKVNSRQTRYAAMESISGLVENNMKENGFKTKCMAKALLYGETTRNTLAASSMTSVMVQEHLLGPMADSISENGKKESNMDMVPM